MKKVSMLTILTVDVIFTVTEIVTVWMCFIAD
jgi:hypothetical protein